MDRTLARLETTSRGAVSESDKQEFSKKIVAATRRKADIESGLAQLDAKFDDQRAKQEANRKMTVGTLRQAEREGRLPFEGTMIDRPTDALVSTKGELLCVGDMIELQKSGEIWKITEVKQDNRSLVLAYLLSETSSTTISVNNIPAFMKVSYSETELALKKLLHRSWRYSELRKSGIDKEAFLAHLPELDIETGSGGVFWHEGKLVLFSDGYSVPEGAVLAWPEPESEDWRKTVCVQYLKIKKSDNWLARDLMAGLFGSDFVRIAESYGRTGTEAEILTLLSEAWNALKQTRGIQNAQEEETLLNSILYNHSVLTKTAHEHYDNTSDIKRMAEDFTRGLLEDASRREKEEREEKERIVNESLKEDPNYKEIPNALVEAFAEIGITVRVNLKEASLAGFKGRRMATYAPFSRWWLQDKNGKMGVLYTMKEILKNRYNAQFSSEWNEHSGAWWHVPSTVKLEELHDLLA